MTVRERVSAFAALCSKGFGNITRNDVALVGQIGKAAKVLESGIFSQKRVEVYVGLVPTVMVGRVNRVVQSESGLGEIVRLETVTPIMCVSRVIDIPVCLVSNLLAYANVCQIIKDLTYVWSRFPDRLDAGYIRGPGRVCKPPDWTTDGINVGLYRVGVG